MTEHTRHQRGIINRYYEHFDTIALQKLSEIVSDLYLAEGSKASKLWESAKTALGKLVSPDDAQAVKVLAERNIAGLAKLVSDLNAGAKTAARGKDTPSGSLAAGPSNLETKSDPKSPTPASTPIEAVAATPASAGPSPEQLKSALKAFRKRLKLTRLDEESKLGRTGNPMSGGKKSAVVAIMAPREYPQPVWDELVRQGKLKRSGGGFYELVGE